MSTSRDRWESFRRGTRLVRLCIRLLDKPWRIVSVFALPFFFFCLPPPAVWEDADAFMPNAGDENNDDQGDNKVSSTTADAQAAAAAAAAAAAPPASSMDSVADRTFT